MMVSQSYQEASRRLLAQGVEELARGDTRQASEKGWGAAAQMLKSIAERRGWEHERHVALGRIIGRLAHETGDVELRRLYRVASDLHTNFYEDLDDADHVAAGLDDVGLLLDKLERLP